MQYFLFFRTLDRYITCTVVLSCFGMGIVLENYNISKICCVKFHLFLFRYQENEKQMEGLVSWTKASVPIATFSMKEFEAFLPVPDQSLKLSLAQPWYIVESRFEKYGKYTILIWCFRFQNSGR